MLRPGLLIAATVVLLPAVGHAQGTLFSENFNTGAASGTNWTTSATAAGADATFGFDFSSIGIPASPNSPGDTIGLQMRVNRPGTNTFSGISTTPNGQSFTGDYTLRFDAWQNFNGPFPAGGSGSTQAAGGGIGANTSTAQFPGGTVNGVYVAATGDGGSASDYRAYYTPSAPSPGAPLAETSGVYAAGNTGGVTNNSNAYYSTNSFGGVPAPAAQTTLFPQQSGTTNPGAAGMEWHTWTVEKSGNTVRWLLRNRNGVDVLIATIDVNDQTFGADSNIFLGVFDINATSSADANADALLFTVFDNVVVLTPVPEPGSVLLATAAGAGAVGLVRRRWRAVVARRGVAV